MKRRHTLVTCLMFLVLSAVFSTAGSDPATITQTAKLTASDSAANHSFGLAVAASGNTVAIGAPGNGSGAGYLFVKPISGWVDATQTAKLTSTSASFNLGASIATNGNTVVAGAPVNTGEVISEADVFVTSGSGWSDMTQTATLRASATSIVDYGLSTAILQPWYALCFLLPAHP
jgi:hypothetical protein